MIEKNKTRILIVTQKVDKNDPILGFFHSWIMELSQYHRSVIVVCLQKGIYDLPENVKVLSLGKEDDRSKFKYVTNFYRYVWRERKNYNVVFVHMNQEYVLLGGVLWKILGKKLYLWRNHKFGNFLTNLSVLLSDQVFCTSKFSYTARFKKTILMPVGIDTNFFRPSLNIEKIPGSILSLGRISRVKRLDGLIEVLLRLKEDGIYFKATIVGSPISVDDCAYERELHLMAEPLVKCGILEFISGGAQDNIIDFYKNHEVFVNLTPAGSMDKTIFEAMACEMMVLVNNENVVKELKSNLVNLLQLNQKDKIKLGEKNRQEVINKHSLFLLVKSLSEIFTTDHNL